MTIWITQRQVAEILGVGPSAVPKMVARGKLHPRPQLRKEPTLDLAEVEALRSRREADERALEQRQDAAVANERTPPDDGNVWLSVPGGRVGWITRQAVIVRARKDQLPSVMKGGRRWIRRDQSFILERAHAVRDRVEAPD